MPLLNLSTDNKELILESSIADDVLDKWLVQPHLPHYQYLQVDILRNCCSDGLLSYKVYTNYPITTSISAGGAYTPGGLVLTANDAWVEFGVTGVAEDNILSARYYTNRNNPDTNIFEWVDLTPAQFVGANAFREYYLIGGGVSTVNLEFTTIDNIVYTIEVEITPGITINSVTVNVLQVIIGDTSTLIVDYTNDQIKFDTTVLNQTTPDDIILDGVYNVDLTLVSSQDLPQVDSINKFFNIKLQCIVTDSVSEDVTNSSLFMLYESLVRSNDCNLTAKMQCKLYDSLIRQLILHGKTAEVASVGCKCGCK